jgi:hypothetical protein
VGRQHLQAWGLEADAVDLQHLPRAAEVLEDRPHLDRAQLDDARGQRVDPYCAERRLEVHVVSLRGRRYSKQK